MSKHQQWKSGPAPTPTAPTLPDGEYFKLFRGSKEFHAYVGAQVLTVKDGKVEGVKEFKFPNVPHITMGVVEREMLEAVGIR
jgi:hypothetical protein